MRRVPRAPTPPCPASHVYFTSSSIENSTSSSFVNTGPLNGLDIGCEAHRCPLVFRAMDIGTVPAALVPLAAAAEYDKRENIVESPPTSRSAATAAWSNPALDGGVPGAPCMPETDAFASNGVFGFKFEDIGVLDTAGPGMPADIGGAIADDDVGVPAPTPLPLAPIPAPPDITIPQS